MPSDLFAGSLSSWPSYRRPLQPSSALRRFHDYSSIPLSSSALTGKKMRYYSRDGFVKRCSPFSFSAPPSPVLTGFVATLRNRPALLLETDDSWACSGHSLFIPLNLSERTPVDSPLAHKEGHRPALFGRSPLAPEALTRLHSVKYGKRPDKPFDNGPQTDIL